MESRKGERMQKSATHGSELPVTLLGLSLEVVHDLVVRRAPVEVLGELLIQESGVVLGLVALLGDLLKISRQLVELLLASFGNLSDRADDAK